MGIFKKLGEFFIGGTANVATEVAGDVADIVARWKPGERDRHEMQMEIAAALEKSYAGARVHDQPQNSGVPIVDALVNGVNRLIRPWVTITVIGSLFGYWQLPPPDNIHPEYWVVAKIILGFWFGGRLVMQDIPAALRRIKR